MAEYTAKEVGTVLFVKEAAAAYSIDELRDSVEKGLPKSTLRNTARRIMGEDYESLMYAVVPRTSFNRRSRLTPAQSEVTVRLARVFTTAVRILGSEEAARAHLLAESPSLGHRRPIDLAMTEIGARQVEDELWGVFYGVVQ